MVNLPRAKKRVPPRYQDVRGAQTALLTSPDGGALIRVIAGDIAGHRGPGSTHTPITLAHLTREELSQAFEDYRGGRLGVIPAARLPHAD